MRFAIIGNGKMASDVLGVVEDTPGAKAVLCLGDPVNEGAQSGLVRACARLGVPYRAAHSLNDAATVEALSKAAIDYIISANNFLIFDACNLALPRCGVVNFHNSALPRYAGLNACSWAIINGEPEHGVTWHLVDEGIDTGAILSQTSFPIADDESAISLIVRCITSGLELFRPLLHELMAGCVEGHPQPLEGRLYKGQHDVPWNGELPWREPIETLMRLARALDFHPFGNMFYRPRIRVGADQPLWIEGFTVDATPTSGRERPPGTIIAVQENTISIAVTGGTLTLFDPRDATGLVHDAASLEERFGTIQGRALADPGV